LIIKTLGTIGISYFPIEVESDTRPGLFRFDIVGLADKTIEESKLRILSAIRNSKLLESKRQNHKIVVLLCPAHIKKEGTYFDLAIAISYLQSLRAISIVKDDWLLFGELGLKGDLKNVQGIQKLLNQAKEFGFSKFIIPEIDREYVKSMTNIELFCAKNLTDVTTFLTGNSNDHLIIKKKTLGRNSVAAHGDSFKDKEFIVDSITGQDLAKRALTISLSGKHNILFYGPPGTGKSLLANSAKELFEYLQYEEIGTQDNTKFRSPHHTISYTQLIGNKNKLGEIHHAHNGILFLDEISEFDRRSLESLRQPLESGEVEFSEKISGIGIDNKVDFVLIATSNLCKCGYLESGIKNCSCSALQVKQYKSKLSGPILDRIDLCVFLRDKKSNYLESDTAARRGRTSGKDLLKQILQTRNIQKVRSDLVLSKHVETGEISKKIKHLYLNKELKKQFLEEDMFEIKKLLANLSVSKRKEDSIVRVARTIADLDNSSAIELRHVLEATSYRTKN